jgi:glycosyltransferase involved in cell wall biosynthesis
MNNKSLPVISIITIVYNGEMLLERTIQSIVNQTYSRIEYIIIDGNSKDRTVEIIKKYSDKISLWQSEPDKGLYDAMNKGIKLAKGDYLLFINAGDELFDKFTIEKIVNSSVTLPDVYYGETLMVDETFHPLGIRSETTPHKLPQHLKWQDMGYGMVVCHQSILIKKTVADLYNIAHPFCADIDWIIKALKKSTSVVNVGFVISKYLKGGLSDKKLKKSLLDRFEVMREHFGLFRTIFNHIFISVRAAWFYNRKR